MNKTRLNLTLFVLALILLSSCGGLNRMRNNAADIRYNVTPEVMEAHANEVDVTIRGTFPARYFHRKAVIEVTPVISWDGGEIALSSITLQGENVRDNHQVIPYSGGSFTHKGKVPFVDGMRISDLNVNLHASLGNNSSDFDPRKIADGVIATSTLVVNQPRPVIDRDRFQRIIPETMESAIYYAVNRADVRQSELRSQQMDEFRQYLEAAVNDERVEIKSVGINAFASPEGPIPFNERLSDQRRQSSDRVLERELKRVGVDKSNDFYNARALGEDWDGFKQLMENSDIADRQLILRVLNMYTDPVVREREIRNLSAVYTEIADKVLPRLRRSEMSINVSRIGFSDEELLEHYRNTQGAGTRQVRALNVEEMLYTATLFDDLSSQYQVYNRASQMYPDDFRTHNSKGVVLMELDNVAAAREAFQRAQKVNDNDVVKNNLGAVALREGNIDRAAEYFASVSSPSTETNYNLGILAIMKGDYAKASGHFGNTPSVNNALAKMLQNNNDDALRIINNIQQPNATAYYLRAIIGARRQDNSMVFDNLRTAVNMNSGMKDYAKTDLEFGRYFQDNTFRSIVN
jgi:tetratricopeptide (TPR) repeat protein